MPDYDLMSRSFGGVGLTHEAVFIQAEDVAFKQATMITVVSQVLKEPAPSCHITAFGATALEYVLWAWISSASEGPTRVRSAMMIAMWDTFERQGVTIPKPGATRVILDKAP